MATNPWKAFLFVACGAGAAAAAAYASGALDPYLADAQGEKVAVASVEEPSPMKAERLGSDAMKPAGEAAVPLPDAASPGAASPTPADKAEGAPAVPAGVVSPTFDIVRVEPDGSIVVAGKAAPHSTVELVTGATVVGAAKAGDEGDFAIVLDEPLKPGGHELVLRSTGADKLVATSEETAVVSIPETEDGQVLALVERPGAPSKLITVPEAQKVAPKISAPDMAAAKPADDAGTSDETVASAPAAAPTPPQAPNKSAAAAPAAAQPAATASASPASGATASGASATPAVTVDAVEIEGRKVFVAGAAEPGRRVRVYANDILLGDAVTEPGGRFLIETERDLPVGDYIIRADALEPNGAKVVARAAVPFEREPGEAIAAVAPEAPAAGTAPTAADVDKTPPAAGGTPAAGGAASPTGDTVAAGEPADAPPPMTADGVPEAPKLQHADGSVIIRRGDTLWRISKRVYGRGVRYSTIYLANQDQITNPDRIWPGQVFNVPGKTKEGEPADMTAVKEQTPPADPKAPL